MGERVSGSGIHPPIAPEGQTGAIPAAGEAGGDRPSLASLLGGLELPSHLRDGALDQPGQAYPGDSDASVAPSQPTPALPDIGSIRHRVLVEGGRDRVVGLREHQATQREKILETRQRVADTMAEHKRRPGLRRGYPLAYNVGDRLEDFVDRHEFLQDRPLVGSLLRGIERTLVTATDTCYRIEARVKTANVPAVDGRIATARAIMQHASINALVAANRHYTLHPFAGTIELIGAFGRSFLRSARAAAGTRFATQIAWLRAIDPEVQTVAGRYTAAVEGHARRMAAFVTRHANAGANTYDDMVYRLWHSPSARQFRGALLRPRQTPLAHGAPKTTLPSEGLAPDQLSGAIHPLLHDGLPTRHQSQRHHGTLRVATAETIAETYAGRYRELNPVQYGAIITALAEQSSRHAKPLTIPGIFTEALLQSDTVHGSDIFGAAWDTLVELAYAEMETDEVIAMPIVDERRFPVDADWEQQVLDRLANTSGSHRTDAPANGVPLRPALAASSYISLPGTASPGVPTSPQPTLASSEERPLTPNEQAVVIAGSIVTGLLSTGVPTFEWVAKEGNQFQPRPSADVARVQAEIEVRKVLEGSLDNEMVRRVLDTIQTAADALWEQGQQGYQARHGAQLAAGDAATMWQHKTFTGNDMLHLARIVHSLNANGERIDAREILIRAVALAFFQYGIHPETAPNNANPAYETIAPMVVMQVMNQLSVPRYTDPGTSQSGVHHPGAAGPNPRTPTVAPAESRPTLPGDRLAQHMLSIIRYGSNHDAIEGAVGVGDAHYVEEIRQRAMKATDHPDIDRGALARADEIVRVSASQVSTGWQQTIEQLLSDTDNERRSPEAETPAAPGLPGLQGIADSTKSLTLAAALAEGIAVIEHQLRGETGIGDAQIAQDDIAYALRTVVNALVNPTPDPNGRPAMELPAVPPIDPVQPEVHARPADGRRADPGRPARMPVSADAFEEPGSQPYQPIPQTAHVPSADVRAYAHTFAPAPPTAVRTSSIPAQPSVMSSPNSSHPQQAASGGDDDSTPPPTSTSGRAAPTPADTDRDPDRAQMLADGVMGSIRELMREGPDAADRRKDYRGYIELRGMTHGDASALRDRLVTVVNEVADSVTDSDAVLLHNAGLDRRDLMQLLTLALVDQLHPSGTEALGNLSDDTLRVIAGETFRHFTSSQQIGSRQPDAPAVLQATASGTAAFAHAPAEPANGTTGMTSKQWEGLGERGGEQPEYLHIETARAQSQGRLVAARTPSRPFPLPHINDYERASTAPNRSVSRPEPETLALARHLLMELAEDPKFGYIIHSLEEAYAYSSGGLVLAVAQSLQQAIFDANDPDWLESIANSMKYRLVEAHKSINKQSASQPHGSVAEPASGLMSRTSGAHTTSPQPRQRRRPAYPVVVDGTAVDAPSASEHISPRRWLSARGIAA